RTTGTAPVIAHAVGGDADPELVGVVVGGAVERWCRLEGAVGCGGDGDGSDGVVTARGHGFAVEEGLDGDDHRDASGERGGAGDGGGSGDEVEVGGEGAQRIADIPCGRIAPDRVAAERCAVGPVQC